MVGSVMEAHNILTIQKSLKGNQTFFPKIKLFMSEPFELDPHGKWE